MMVTFRYPNSPYKTSDRPHADLETTYVTTTKSLPIADHANGQLELLNPKRIFVGTLQKLANICIKSYTDIIHRQLHAQVYEAPQHVTKHAGYSSIYGASVLRFMRIHVK